MHAIVYYATMCMRLLGCCRFQPTTLFYRIPKQFYIGKLIIILLLVICYVSLSALYFYRCSHSCYFWHTNIFYLIGIDFKLLRP